MEAGELLEVLLHVGLGQATDQLLDAILANALLGEFDDCILLDAVLAKVAVLGNVKEVLAILETGEN